MQKLSVALLAILLVIASCTKKASPTSGTSKPAIDAAPLYAQNCARCHGATGVEGKAPNLSQTSDSKNEIVDKITNGAGRMPAFAGKLSNDEIDAVAQFVLRLKK